MEHGAETLHNARHAATMNFKIYHEFIDPQSVTDRMIRNPNYGGRPCSVPGTCIIPVVENRIKPKFFVALRKSVEENGFRNPILLYNTPEGLLLSFGGSRLRVAKALGKEIPAIIVDYVGTYSKSERVLPSHWMPYFQDVPVLFKFTDIGIETHYNLERNRRKYYDPEGMAWTAKLDDTEFLNEEFPWLSESV